MSGALQDSMNSSPGQPKPEHEQRLNQNENYEESERPEQKVAPSTPLPKSLPSDSGDARVAVSHKLSSPPDPTAPRDSGNSSGPLPQPNVMDWQGLQNRYYAAMQAQSDQEGTIYHDLNRLLEYYSRWAQSSAARDEDRAASRLRTRMAYVTHNERELEGKRQHHETVVKAFEDALRLLNQA